MYPTAIFLRRLQAGDLTAASLASVRMTIRVPSLWKDQLSNCNSLISVLLDHSNIYRERGGMLHSVLQNTRW